MFKKAADGIVGHLNELKQANPWPRTPLWRRVSILLLWDICATWKGGCG